MSYQYNRSSYPPPPPNRPDAQQYGQGGTYNGDWKPQYSRGKYVRHEEWEKMQEMVKKHERHEMTQEIVNDVVERLTRTILPDILQDQNADMKKQVTSVLEGMAKLSYEVADLKSKVATQAAHISFLQQAAGALGKPVVTSSRRRASGLISEQGGDDTPGDSVPRRKFLRSASEFPQHTAQLRELLSKLEFNDNLIGQVVGCVEKGSTAVELSELFFKECSAEELKPLFRATVLEGDTKARLPTKSSMAAQLANYLLREQGSDDE